MKKKNFFLAVLKLFTIYSLLAFEAAILAAALSYFWYDHQNWFYHFSKSGSLEVKDTVLPLFIGLYSVTGLAIVNNVLKEDIVKRDTLKETSEFTLPLRSHILMTLISAFLLFFITSWYYQNIAEGRMIVFAAFFGFYFAWRITILMDNRAYTTINIFKIFWRWLKG